MTKRESFLFIIVFVFFLTSLGALIYFVTQYLNMKVEKSRVVQTLQQVRNNLELTKQEVKSREKDIEQLKHQISKFKDKVLELKKKIQKLEDEKKELVEDMNDLKDKYADIDDTLEEKSQQIWRLKKELMRSRYRLFTMEEYLKDVLKNRKVKKIASSVAIDRQQSEPGQVSLGTIVVGDKEANSSGISARVLSVNTKYNFAILAVDRYANPQVGWKVKVELPNGKTFVSIVDTVRRNMITMDVPKDIEIAVGDKAKVVVLN